MPDLRIEKLADVLVNYSVAVKPGDKVLIQGGPVAEPLFEAVYVKILQAGGHPLTRVQLPNVGELRYRYASDEQLEYIPDVTKQIFETYDVIISFWSDLNTKVLSSVPPEKIVLSQKAQADLSKTFMQRMGSGDLRWVGTLFPTHAYAQDAEMGLAEYEDFVYGACLPDFDDPVGYWKSIAAQQQKLVDWLKGKNDLRVEAPGVDLRMKITDRLFVNCCGTRNMPDGEIFTGPVEDSVEGHIRFSYPTVYQGRKLEGVELTFEKGRVVKATADKGEDFLLKTIDIDEGARYVGEFAIGTNKGVTRATGHTLFDEKINGSIHMALGAGIPESGSQNQSAIHWDMVCDMMGGGRIWIDDELFYENGAFMISL